MLDKTFAWCQLYPVQNDDIMILFRASAQFNLSRKTEIIETVKNIWQIQSHHP